MTRALAGKVSIPLTSIALGLRLTFAGLLAVFLLEVVSFALKEPAILTLEELEADLLGAGKDWLKLGLPVVADLELSLSSVR